MAFIILLGEKDNPEEYFKATNCPSFVSPTLSPSALSEITNEMNVVTTDKIYPSYTPKTNFVGQALAHSTPIAASTTTNPNNQVRVYCIVDTVLYIYNV